MKDLIERMIYEYEQKTSDCDIILSDQSMKLKRARRNNDLDQVEEFRKNIAVKNAQRQAYVQVIADFDALLDANLEPERKISRPSWA